MLVLFSKEKVLQVLDQNIRSWESVSGIPNINAYDFDPQTTDPAELEKLGYYDSPEAWVAALRIKELKELMIELEELPPFKGRQI